MTECEKLKEIAHLLIKNNYKEKELGLLAGKTGKIIFFFLYYQYTSKSIYKDFAEALLDDVCEELGDEIYFDYRKGLYGIGWGIDYLMHNQFVSDESEDIFEELDNLLLNKFLTFIKRGYCKPKDIALYVISRYSHENPKLIPAYQTGFIPELIDAFNTYSRRDDTALIEDSLRLIYEGNKFKCKHNFFLENEIRRERKLNLVSEGLLLLLNNIKIYG